MRRHRDGTPRPGIGAREVLWLLLTSCASASMLAVLGLLVARDLPRVSIPRPPEGMVARAHTAGIVRSALEIGSLVRDTEDAVSLPCVGGRFVEAIQRIALAGLANVELEAALDAGDYEARDHAISKIAILHEAARLSVLDVELCARPAMCLVGGGCEDLSTKAWLDIVHHDRMGSAYRLESATYLLDGRVLPIEVDVPGELARTELEGNEPVAVWSGAVAPGDHELTVELVYRGRGYGVFRYLNEHTFEAHGALEVHGEPGRALEVTVTGREQCHWPGTPLEGKPSVELEVAPIIILVD